MPRKPVHIRGDFSSTAFCVIAILIYGIGQQLFFAQVFPGQLIHQYTDNHTYMVHMLESAWWRNHGWFAQMNAPDGTLLHWTFPFMTLVSVLALPFWAFMSWPDAVLYAGSICAPLLYLAIGLVSFRLARYLMTPGWACIAAIIVLSARPILTYSPIGRPDHHLLSVLLVVLFWLALVGMDQSLKAGKRHAYACLAGLGAALAIWTTPETMPGLVLGIALQTWGRIIDWPEPASETPRPIKQHLATDAIFSLLWIVGIFAALQLDPPYEGLWATTYDRLSVLHLTFAAFTGILILGRTLILSMIQTTGSRRILHQTTGVGILGLLVVGGFVSLFPNVHAGAINHVAPELHSWIANIQEMQPSIKAYALVVNMGVPILGLFGLVLLWENRQTLPVPLRLKTLGALAVLTALTMVGTMYFRFAYFAVVAAAPFATLLLIQLSRTRIGFLQPEILLPLIIGLPLLIINIVDALEKDGEIQYRLFAVATNGVNNTALPPDYADDGRLIPLPQPIGQAACKNFPMVDYLKEIEPDLKANWTSDDPIIIMAYQNPGPAILFYTDFNVVSGPYHRNTEGLLDERRFFGTPGTEALNEVIDRRHIAVAAVCVKPVIDQPELERPGVYDWALNGGDDRFGVALEIPGEWVILARRELLDDWAPVIKQADPDDAEAPAIDTDNNSNNSG